MPQEIYNEGRVVGFSAWEIFAREALNNGMDPSIIPNESQWLSAMIGMGASMILRIPAGISAGVHDFELPQDSNLTASTSIIIANPFIGECAWDLSNWATKVTSYSSLILNNDSPDEHPSTGVPEVPGTADDIDTYLETVPEFNKIVDGIVYTKNAIWHDTDSGDPYKDIDPNFNNSSTVIRLNIVDNITKTFCIIFSGFNNKRILQALSGYATGEGGGSADTNTNDWINGGMLGPEIIPWATKIVFSTPNISHIMDNLLGRKFPSDRSFQDKTIEGIVFKNNQATVRCKSLLDFQSLNLPDYYVKHSSEFQSNPVLAETVSTISLGANNSCNTLTAWYPGMTATKVNNLTSADTVFPPALYAAQITASGSQSLIPLDVAAPGTMKGFKNSMQAYNYTQQMPDNYSIYYDPTNQSFTFVTPNQPDATKWSGTAKIDYLTEPKAQISAGNNSIKVIGLSKSDGTDYGTNGSASTTASAAANRGKLTWDILLNALKSNSTYDLIGDKMRSLATDLDSNKIGVNLSLTDVRSSQITVTGSYPVSITTSRTNGTNVAKLQDNTSLRSGTNFIEFSNGKRLYISPTNPGTSNVPEGSIGIGW